MTACDAYDRGSTAQPLIAETIGDNLRRNARRFADRPALIARHQSLRYTYGEFDAAVDTLARALLAEGIANGDRVGVWGPNSAEWALLQYATARIGAILVSLNPAYRTSEIAYALRQSGCRMLAAAPSFKDSDYQGMVAAVGPEVPALEIVVFFGEPSWHALLARAGAVTQQQLLVQSAQLAPDDPINIQYTSGTTGSPKGATLSHSNILNNGYFVAERCRITHKDLICVPVPYYHCFGMVMGNLAATSHGARGRGDAAAVARSIGAAGSR
jgi:fatty-acyl-CoA synthase